MFCAQRDGLCLMAGADLPPDEAIEIVCRLYLRADAIEIQRRFRF